MIQHTLKGTVYGVILNDHRSLQKIGPLDGAPYQGAPQAPVLYLKPANTHAASGAVIRLPQGAGSVEVAASIGLVMGREAARLTESSAMDAVAGGILVADLSLPHRSYYRPAIREKCFDGALPMSAILPLPDLSALILHTEIDGKQVDEYPLSGLIRSPARLLAEVSAFITLRQGDVLLLGIAYLAPQAHPGSTIRITAPGFGSLEFSLAAQGVCA